MENRPEESPTMEILLVDFSLTFERGADYADYAELRVYNSNLKMFWKKRERKNEKKVCWQGGWVVFLTAVSRL